jgi:hypothetical protein
MQTDRKHRRPFQTITADRMQQSGRHEFNERDE